MYPVMIQQSMAKRATMALHLIAQPEIAQVGFLVGCINAGLGKPNPTPESSRYGSQFPG